MKRKLICLLLAVCLALTGCGRRRYISVRPHREQRHNAQSEASVAENSLDLIHIMEKMVRSGNDHGIIFIPEYPDNQVERGMDVAIGYAMNTDPLGAYAVEDIHYEVGTNAGLPAMAVDISYRQSAAQLRQIRNIVSMGEAKPMVEKVLKEYGDQLVLQAQMYFDTDFQQMVRDFAESNPEYVMETPQVTVDIYGTGPGRVVELNFAYQNGRDALRSMQAQVKPVFDAAALYVSGSGADRQKFAQLYAFLMERFEYTVETSITPAYSLLHHGVGDSRAFATVYAAMCRQAGLECLVVTGTRSGEPWVWNIVSDNGTYQHVDLLRCSDQGRFREVADRDMGGYVWDYSAYPECPVIWSSEAPEETEEAEETTVLDAEKIFEEK